MGLPSQPCNFRGFVPPWPYAPHIVAFAVVVVAIIPCQCVGCGPSATRRATVLVLAYQCVRMAYWRWVQQKWRHVRADVLLTSWLWGLGTTVFVRDRALVSKLGREDVVGDDSASYYFACANPSVLGSAGERWRRDMRVIHPWIVSYVGPRILERARAAGPPPPAACADVCLFDWLGAHIGGISAEAIGVPAWDVRRTLTKVVFFYTLTSLTADVWRWLGRIVFRRSRDDRHVRARLEDAPPGLRRVVDCFGVDAAVGHVYAVMLGSTIPETTVACDLLLGLAGDPGRQAEVRAWAADGEPAFEAFVRDQCAEHAFFTYGKSRRMPHTGEVCRIDHKTARTPWGVGLRACPGARIGLHTVSAVCRHVLLDYELSLCDTSQSECARPVGRLLALLGIRASDWTQTGWGMGVHHLMRWRAHIRLTRLAPASGREDINSFFSRYR